MALDRPFPPPPHPDAKPITVPPHEQDKYDTVLAHFSDPSFRVKGDNEDEKTELAEYEKFWLSKECLLRYLRATKWDVAAAITRLESTLAWRRSYGFYRQDFAQHVEPEGLTGKCLPAGYDVDGRPCVYLIPSRQNTESSARQLEYTYFMIECAIDMMGPGIENVALCINFGDKGKSPPLWVARDMLYILQNHYPERLGKAFVINIPWLVDAFLRIIMQFVDPVTKTKVHFNPDVVKENLISSDMLLREWKGDMELIYEHDTYWPELLRLTTERRSQNMQRWRSLGAKVGVSEWDYKDGSGEMRTEEMEKDTMSMAGEANEELRAEQGTSAMVVA